VKVLREEVEEAFVIRLIAALKRIHENEAPAGF
jgi:hypothetical protein